MATRKRPDRKVEALKEMGCLNPHPQDVTDELFQKGDFFDPRDRVQVKYEMLRRVEVEGQPVTRSAKSFGFSRPSFYQAQAAFQQGGLAELVPKKRGPRKAHKLSNKVMDFLTEVRRQDPSIRAPALAQRMAEHFGFSVHPRSIERALAREGKRGL